MLTSRAVWTKYVLGLEIQFYHKQCVERPLKNHLLMIYALIIGLGLLAIPTLDSELVGVTVTWAWSNHG